MNENSKYKNELKIWINIMIKITELITDLPKFARLQFFNTFSTKSQAELYCFLSYVCETISIQ